MQLSLISLFLAGSIPLLLALMTHYRTSLCHALVWALLAWLAWGISAAMAPTERALFESCRFTALCLTGCAGVAVLGARRPIAFAWNFVVLSLFAVMMWPLMEVLLIGGAPMSELRLAFLASTVVVAIVNYLPTRLGPAAVLLLLVCAGQLTLIYTPTTLLGSGDQLILNFALAFVPWLGWICLWTRRTNATHANRLWQQFRDAWGLMWGQRAREQFNRAAENAGWSIRLSWSGLIDGSETRTGSDQEKVVETLQATLQRFFETNQR